MSESGSDQSNQPATRTISWQYACFNPEEWPDDCEQELVRQNQLWNKLVEIERAHRLRVAALISTDPVVAELEQALADIDQEIEALVKERAALRKQARAKIATDDIDARIETLKAERRRLFAELKRARADKRETERAALRILADERYTALADARRASGLWWGNYNAVCASFDAAIRALPPGAVIRFHAWDGTGRVTNQIQGGIEAELFEGGRHHAQLWLEPLPPVHRLRRRGAGKKGLVALLTATVWAKGAAERRVVSWPILMHRSFPADAVIKTLTITRRRTPGGEGWRWRATFACQVPAPVSIRPRLCAGIDTGWRSLADGQGIRVGTIAGADGGLDHVTLSQAWLDRRLYAAKLQGEADELLNLLAPTLYRLGREGVPPILAELWARALPPPPARIRHRLLVELVRLWRSHPVNIRRWQPNVREDLEIWLQQRTEFVHLLDKLSVRRREEYRIAAKAIAERYTDIALDRIAVQRLAADKEIPLPTRRLRTWAAPYDLAAEIRRAVAGAGGTLTQVSGPTTLVCHVCGHQQSPRLPASRSELFWRCENDECRELWDQDLNAAKNLLAYLTGDGASSGGLRPDSSPLRPTQTYQRSRLVRKKPKPGEPPDAPQPPI